MVSLMIPSSTSFPTASKNLGPPEIPPSLVAAMISKTPLLFPCSSVGYQFSSTLSENSKGSGVNCSFLIVTTSKWYPVVFSSSCNFPLIAPLPALLKIPPSSTM